MVREQKITKKVLSCEMMVLEVSAVTTAHCVSIMGFNSHELAGFKATNYSSLAKMSDNENCEGEKCFVLFSNKPGLCFVI